jgi:hypothetical protein
VQNCGSDLDGPQLWAQLCECLQAVGDTNGAIAMYQDVISRAHTLQLLPCMLACDIQHTNPSEHQTFWQI